VSAGIVLAIACSLGAAASPTVTLLPLQADKGATDKQATGVSARVREAIEVDDFAKLLKEPKDAARRANSCGLQVPCLGEAAATYGVDLVLAGTVAGAEGGLLLTLVVVEPEGDRALRREEVLLVGDGDDARLDRIARSILNPTSLRGQLMVEGGEDGAVVVVDGLELGVLPFDGPRGAIVEGSHDVVVSKEGFEPFERRVMVRHKEVTTVRALLVPIARSEAAKRLEDDGKAAGVPWGPIALGGGAVVLAAGGAVAGTFALLESLEVERKAQSQNLLFPRDEEQLARGTALAITANVLYVAALATAAGAGAWWFMSQPEEP
jgi:hypothetical protein